MKKMTSSKAKAYAKRLYDLENRIEKSTDREELKELTIKINNIVDNIVEEYEPTAMYKIDEEVYKLASEKNKSK